ncbi:hypothetical protein Tco_1012644 [Tanacetum coccineum]
MLEAGELLKTGSFSTDLSHVSSLNWFHFVNEDEEDVMGPITIMSEIKDAVRDEKLYGRMVIYIVSNKNRCKSKKEMEPAAVCASMAALAAASLAVMYSACASRESSFGKNLIK